VFKKAVGDGPPSGLHRSNQENRTGEPRTARKPHGTRPVVKLFSHDEWMCLLDAITEHGDRFFSQLEEYITADYAKTYHSKSMYINTLSIFY
jgi:hypothetical protein